MEHNRDIFISYKNDGEGNNFAARLCKDLEKMGYDVYYNPNEQHAGSFPDRLRNAVESCKDFLLILTKPCLEQLMRHDKIDWVREELLTAHKNGKNIIPLLMPGVAMPKDKNDMPDELRFLPDTDAVSIFEPYDKSPLSILLGWVKSKPEKEDLYKDTFNSNLKFNVSEEIEILKKEAKSGSSDAMYELANMYYYGIINDEGTSARDYSNAFKWFLKATEHDDSSSNYASTMIARMYNDGVALYGEQSYEKAFDFHSKAAVLNGESAQTIAYMKWMGRGCDFDYYDVEKLYKDYLKKGNDTAKLDLAKFYITYGKYNEAIETYNSMKHIPPSAEYEMGMIYKNGVLSNEIKPDFFRAACHFHNALNCEHPYALAAKELGNIYFNGCDGFKVDFEKAKHYYLIGAEQGEVYCQYILGFMYEFGMLKTDLHLSEKYFLLADSQGDIHSAHHLAMLYQQPELKNYYKAYCFARKSAKNGKPEGEYIYANLLYIGRGCEPNIHEAYKYYKLAFEHGIYQAKFMMERIEKIAKE